ncbi:MAG: triose-phosphate isomerase [Rhodobacteraceae bacterium CG17_big_fil_post_rev_8_21_14_2_50_63_15]|nr:triose-phosphate isomerase [Roseovarius sp.]PIV78746.1 MAG: triose-phosphate isomerase [Rhodobacteraceae bacterium CG17_big_fil_post_rev_8_21_14_2_50_63_15]
MKRKLVVGNWKMNGMTASLREIQKLGTAHPAPTVDILVCPPATLIATAAGLMAKSAIEIGAQDCHSAGSGAFTGDISAAMLSDIGAKAVIVGHSERREYHKESSALVSEKARSAHAAGLIAVICLGETEAERAAGQTLAIIADQLDASLPAGTTGDNTVIAYEPVWAIGSGLTPDRTQIAEVHDFLRDRLGERIGTSGAQAIRLLYGGSVKATNAAAIFAISNVDGALVGGASLLEKDFTPIIKALMD